MAATVLWRNKGLACWSSPPRSCFYFGLAVPRYEASFAQGLRRVGTSSSRFRKFDSRFSTGGERLDTGSSTLEAVVQELRSKGRLPGQVVADAASPKPSRSRPESSFIDIDEALMEDVEGASGGNDAAKWWAGGGYRANAADGELGESEEGGMGTEGREDDKESHQSWEMEEIPSRSRSRLDEDVLHLSEEELRERVRRSIEELVPASAAGAVSGGQRPDEELTPAQLFYLENRQSLVQRAQEYYLAKQEEQLRETGDVEDEWRYYHDPVVRPVKGHLWSTGEEADGHGPDHQEMGYLQTIAEWPRGQVPPAEMLADLMRREQARDVIVIDLHACGRADLGTHAVIGTGVTPRHCKRVGEIVVRAVQHCNPPHVEAFCYGTRNDEWIVAHCGPIKVHIFTTDCRDLYQLEMLWQRPDEFFLASEFPHYLPLQGVASHMFVANPELIDGLPPPSAGAIGSHGARSTAIGPPVFRDELHRAMIDVDYAAADDARYSQVMDLHSAAHAVPEAVPPASARRAKSDTPVSTTKEDNEDWEGWDDDQGELTDDEVEPLSRASVEASSSIVELVDKAILESTLGNDRLDEKTSGLKSMVDCDDRATR